MALFEGAKRVPGSRSHSRLVVSEGFSPAERWITDDTLNPLFEYHYGGPGFVAIPKGTIVAVGANQYDYETGREVTVLTIADDSSKQPAGVAPYNIYQRVQGRLYHNFPSLITRDYIEVPLLASIEDVYRNADGTPLNTGVEPTDLNSNSLKMRWGCAYGTLAPGDYLTADKYGKFVKYEGEDFKKVVGQALAVETDLPPTGWLKWLDWAEEHGERADDQNNQPYPTKPDDGRQYHPDYKWPLTPDYRGIPGMTDGGQTDQVDVTNEATGANSVAHSLKDGSQAGTITIFRLANSPIVDDADFTMEVQLDGTNWTSVTGDYQVDNTTGWVYYSLSSDDQTAVNGQNRLVRFTYKYHSTLNLGTPAAWDFKGSTGAVRILLKF